MKNSTILKTLLISILALLAVQANASEVLLCGYEPNETNLTLSSPDTGMILTKVQGGIGGAPEATQGDYVLKATWTGQPDGKVELKHQWTGTTFNLAGKDLILVDVYMTTQLSPQLAGVWDDVFGWHQGIWPPSNAGQWQTLSFNVSHSTQEPLNHITALLFQDMAASSGTIYIDNLRLFNGLPVDTTVEIRDGWFYVNGEKFFVKGTCFFENHDYGRCSMEELNYEFRRIKEAGFNTIRTWLLPDELELARQHGLMVMQGANHLFFSYEYEDPQTVQSIIADTQNVVGYSAPYNNILYYIIDNEPTMHKSNGGIYNEGEAAVNNFYRQIIATARGVKPNIFISVPLYPAASFLDCSIFDCESLNLYPFCIADSSLGYQKYLEWYKKEIAGGDKPLIVTEYGWPIPLGLAGFSAGMLDMLDKQINANAAGSFNYIWRSWGPENIGDNYWLGIVPYTGEANSYKNPPRQIYNDYKQYFEAVLINPKNNTAYTGSIPVEVYGTEHTASVEAVLDGRTYNLTKTGTYWWQGSIAADGNFAGVKTIMVRAKNGKGNILAEKSRNVIIGRRPVYTVNIARSGGQLKGGDTYNAIVTVTDSNNNRVGGQGLRIGVNQTAVDLWSSKSFSGVTNSSGQYEFSLADISYGYFELMAGIDADANAILSNAGIDIVRVERPPISQGLKYKYYEGQWTSIPNFDSLTPVESGQVQNFLLTVKKRSDYFGIRFSGYIDVAANGTYTFFTNSDDGSKLYIDGMLVVNYDGLHGTDGDVGGSIALSAGKHSIMVDYFESLGAEDLIVSYAGPGVTKQHIASNVLSWCDLEFDLDENCRIDFEDLRIFSENWLSEYDFFDYAKLANDWGAKP